MKSAVRRLRYGPGCGYFTSSATGRTDSVKTESAVDVSTRRG